MTTPPERAGEKRSFEDDEWSAEMADDFLRRNGGENDSDVVPIPEVMFVIEQKAEENFFLLEGGVAGRRALMRRFPFDAIGTTPEAVFDRVGFFIDTDGTFEMHRILDIEELNRQIEASPDLTFRPAKRLRIHGRRWKDFQSMAGTLRAFSSVLSIADASDDWNTPEAEDARIRGVMKGMAAMASGTLLRDREPDAKKTEPTPATLELTPESEGICRIAAALED